MNNNFDSLLSDRAIKRGGLHLYHYDDAVLLINLCSRNNIQILGIDAFFVSDGRTQPVLEHSIDFSSEETIKGNEYAYKFLEAKKSLDLVYEIVY